MLVMDVTLTDAEKMIVACSFLRDTCERVTGETATSKHATAASGYAVYVCVEDPKEIWQGWSENWRKEDQATYEWPRKLNLTLIGAEGLANVISTAGG